MRESKLREGLNDTNKVGTSSIHPYLCIIYLQIVKANVHKTLYGVTLRYSVMSKTFYSFYVSKDGVYLFKNGGCGSWLT